MPRKLLNLQGARFLDREKVINQLKKLARTAKKKNKNILKIILFGSLAKDSYIATSDADILILIKRDSRRPADRIPDFIPYFLSAEVSTDLFPFTEQEAKKNSLAQRAMKEGIPLT